MTTKDYVIRKYNGNDEEYPRTVVTERSTGKYVLIILSVEGFERRTGAVCINYGARELTDTPGEKVCVVRMDSNFYHKNFFLEPKFGRLIATYETGRYVKDYFRPEFRKRYGQEKNSYCCTLETEFELDKFVVEQCGADDLIEWFERKVKHSKDWITDVDDLKIAVEVRVRLDKIKELKEKQNKTSTQNDKQ